MRAIFCVLALAALTGCVSTSPKIQIGAHPPVDALIISVCSNPAAVFFTDSAGVTGVIEQSQVQAIVQTLSPIARAAAGNLNLGMRSPDGRVNLCAQTRRSGVQI